MNGLALCLALCPVQCGIKAQCTNPSSLSNHMGIQGCGGGVHLYQHAESAFQPLSAGGKQGDAPRCLVA